MHDSRIVPVFQALAEDLHALGVRCVFGLMSDDTAVFARPLILRGRSISRLAAADRARPCFPAPSPDDAEVLDATDPTPCRP